MNDPRKLTTDQVNMFLNETGHQKPFKVIFLKANGEQRAMTCMMEKSATPPKNPNTVPVMDLEKGAWRSFNKDSVLFLEAVERI